MALYRGSIRSDILKMDTVVNVIIPESHYVAPKTENRTLILLHGLKQNADTWQRMSRAESYAHPANLNIIMPEVQRSFYTSMKYGLDYFRFISEELPYRMGCTFRIPTDRDHLFVGGLSMGGYGAIRCALTAPDRWGGALSFSGALRTLEDAGVMETIMPKKELQGILGMECAYREEDDLMALLKRSADAPHKPMLYIACGTEDPLAEQNRQVASAARSLGYDVVQEEWKGIHDWAFWDRALVRGIAAMTALDAQNINSLEPGLA